MSAPEDRVWHKGPPPCVGWYEASLGCEVGTWRWWDGEVWSLPVPTRHGANVAEMISMAKSNYEPDHVKWTDYWPGNARVPRHAGVEV